MLKVNEKQKKIVNAVIFFTQPFYDETYNNNPICDRQIEKARQKRNMRHTNKIKNRRFFKRVKKNTWFQAKK